MQKKTNETPRVGNTGFLAILLILGLAVAFIIWRSNAPKEQKRTQSSSTTRGATKNQTGSIDPMKDTELLGILRESAAGVPEAEELVSFTEQNADFGVLYGELIAETTAKNSPNKFTVVQGASEDFLQIFGLPIGFDRLHNLLLVPEPKKFTNVLLGALMLHELKHVRDTLSGILPVAATPQQMVEGEQRAYDLEIRVLDQRTDGRLMKYVRSVLDAQNPTVTTCRLARGLQPEFIKAAVALYPPAQYTPEIRIRAFIALVALNRENALRTKTDPLICLQKLLDEERAAANRPQ